MEKKIRRGIWIAAFALLFAMMSGKAGVKAADDVWIEWGEEYQGDANYYFMLDESSKVTITDLTGTKKCQLHKVDMYTGEVTDLGSTYDVTGSITITLGEGCYYCVVTDHYGNRERCIKKFICQQCNPDVDEIEANDTFDTAQEIKANILYGGNYNYYYYDKYDIDCYKITLAEPGLVWLETFGYTETTVYAEDEYLNTYEIQTIVASGNNYCKSDRIMLSKGTYYIRIRSNYYDYPFSSFGYRELGVVYKFKINYEKIDLTTSEMELNDILLLANSINTNQTYTGNSETSDDVDYYKFTLAQTSKVQLRFDQPRGTVAESYFIELIQYDEDSETELRLDKITTTSNPVTFGEEVVLEAGDYYVKVTGQEADSFVDYKLKVNAEKYILVKEIGLTTSTKTFNTGTSFTLKATVTPSDAIDKTVTWSSSDETVATVDKKGKVKCLKPGECYIYARANDASGTIGRYHLVVAKSKTNTLKTVTVSAGTLSPEFDSSKRSYKIELDKDTSKVTIKWARSSVYSKVYVNDEEASRITVSVKAGQKKTVKVVVVSESGAERTYKFVVERAYK